MFYLYRTSRTKRLEYEWICPYCGTKSSDYYVVEGKMYYSDRGTVFGKYSKEILASKEKAANSIADKDCHFQYKAFLKHFEKKKYKTLNVHAECDKCRKRPAWSRSKIRDKIYLLLSVIIPLLALITYALISEWKTVVRLGYRWVPLVLVWLVVLLVVAVMVVTAILKRKEKKKYHPENFPKLLLDKGKSGDDNQ